MTSPVPTCTCNCGSSDSPLSITASIISLLTFALGVLASYIALQSATRGAPSEVARLVDDLRATQHEINRVAEYIFDDEAEMNESARTGTGKSTRGIRFLGGRPAYAMPDDDEGGEERGGSWSSREGSRSTTSKSTGSTSKTPQAAVHDTTATTTTTNTTPAPGPTILPPSHALYTETQTLLTNCVRLFYEADTLLKRSQADARRWDLQGLWNRVTYVMNRHEVGEKMQRLGEQKARLAALQLGVFVREGRGRGRVLGEVVGLCRDLGMGRGSEGEGSGVLVGRGGEE